MIVLIFAINQCTFFEHPVEFIFAAKVDILLKENIGGYTTDIL